jgi:hypothetical protein
MASDGSTAVARAIGDIEAGRLWKARDRLSAAVRDSPTDQGILELLGEVYFRMGDQPAAWRYWVLTTREGADVDAAKLAFEERYGRAGLADRLSQIPAYEPLADYPIAVRERVVELRQLGRAEGIDWPRSRAQPSKRQRDNSDSESSGCFGATVIGILLVGPWLLGLVVVLYLIGRAVVGAL